MSFWPEILTNLWEDSEEPFEQLLTPSAIRILGAVPVRVRYPTTSTCGAGYYNRPWPELVRKGEGGVSTVKADKDKFTVVLDVQQFAPEEIKVKVVDRYVIVEGKHEEKEDEHGWISREFTRRYMVPEQCDIEQVSSKLSSDGVLAISVERKQKPAIQQAERVIDIEHTGKPAAEQSDVPKEKGEQPS